jgi:hypothetical protein
VQLYRDQIGGIIKGVRGEICASFSGTGWREVLLVKGKIFASLSAVSRLIMPFLG